MTSQFHMTFVVFACLLAARVESYRLTINPYYGRVNKDPNSISFTCTADVALVGCQFRWLDHKNNAGPLLELSRGSQSQANSSYLDASFTGYSYAGRGLGEGDCGVSMNVNGGKVWMVACRVRTETGGWTYEWADLFADDKRRIPHTRTPRQSVVLPGGKVKLSFAAEMPLKECHFHLPGYNLNFDQGVQSADSTSRAYYFGGGGLRGGLCGLVLTNVSEADNGPIWGWIKNIEGTKADFRLMALTVARPPSPPTLSVVYSDAGATATCVVHGGRPVAQISWLLGDKVQRQNARDDSLGNPEDEWIWPWMQRSIMQTLTIKREAKYDGMILKCVVNHETWTHPQEVAQMISFSGL